MSKISLVGLSAVPALSLRIALRLRLRLRFVQEINLFQIFLEFHRICNTKNTIQLFLCLWGMFWWIPCIILLILSYIIIGIIFLSDEKNQYFESCSNFESGIWAYGFISIFIILFNGCCYKYNPTIFFKEKKIQESKFRHLCCVSVFFSSIFDTAIIIVHFFFCVLVTI
jgi:hypothetical protein